MALVEGAHSTPFIGSLPSDSAFAALTPTDLEALAAQFDQAELSLNVLNSPSSAAGPSARKHPKAGSHGDERDPISEPTPFSYNPGSGIEVWLSEDGARVTKKLGSTRIQAKVIAEGVLQLRTEREVYEALAKYRLNAGDWEAQFHHPWPFPSILDPLDPLQNTSISLDTTRVEGMELGKFMDSKPYQTLFRRLWWAGEICSALKILHSIEITHGDVCLAPSLGAARETDAAPPASPHEHHYRAYGLIHSCVPD